MAGTVSREEGKRRGVPAEKKAPSRVEKKGQFQRERKKTNVLSRKERWHQAERERVDTLR